MLRKISLAPLEIRDFLMGLIIASLVLVGFGGPIGVLSGSYGVKVVLAQEVELPDPGLTPDNPFYFLERIWEGIGTFFTFGDLKKAERYASLASERIAEAKAVVEKGKPELAEKTLKRYEAQLNKAISRAEKAGAKGKSVAGVSEKVADATGKHLLVLEEVLDKVPEAAKSAIEKAKEVSMNGQKNALRVLARENPDSATEINLKAIEGRLKKAKIKAEKEDIAGVEEAISEFEDKQKFGEEIPEIAKGFGKDITGVEQLVVKATPFHLQILTEVYEKVPEQAEDTIEKAIEVLVVKWYERAVKVLKEKEALDEVPETPPPIPPETPPPIPEKGVLEGTVNFMGLPCPPEAISGRLGTTPPCDGPYPNYKITIYGAEGKVIIATTNSDENGNYRISLDPGNYIIYTLKGASVLPEPELVPHRITIVGGRTTKLDLVIDTGIR